MEIRAMLLREREAGPCRHYRKTCGLLCVDDNYTPSVSHLLDIVSQSILDCPPPEQQPFQRQGSKEFGAREISHVHLPQYYYGILDTIHFCDVMLLREDVHPSSVLHQLKPLCWQLGSNWETCIVQGYHSCVKVYALDMLPRNHKKQNKKTTNCKHGVVGCCSSYFGTKLRFSVLFVVNQSHHTGGPTFTNPTMTLSYVTVNCFTHTKQETMTPSRECYRAQQRDMHRHFYSLQKRKKNDVVTHRTISPIHTQLSWWAFRSSENFVMTPCWIVCCIVTTHHHIPTWATIGSNRKYLHMLNP